ncbi:MAG: RNA polymerase sigma factor [Planctomycetes bacterium]|nr:RNA polymerase sigma factor [Planctomycetota bacterium]MBZ0152271.1 RNA polymerase sigma factor [Planctomycetota bacterium]MCC7398665.1 RNA polymerase sigma factor [Planctomycetota bacterium]
MRTFAPLQSLLPRRLVRRLPSAPCGRRRSGQNQGPLAHAPFLDDNTRNLVSRALEQDREAIELLFQRYRDRLRAALRKLIGPKYRLLMADSEDATHDAILSALRRLHQFEYRGEGSFLAWLLKGAEYEIVRRIRALETRKRTAGAGLVGLDAEVEQAVATKDATPSQLHDEHELAERIRVALQQLPDREREIIVLRRYLELGTEEICAEMGLPTEGAVRALLSRAQARLSGLLSRTTPGAGAGTPPAES